MYDGWCWNITWRPSSSISFGCPVLQRGSSPRPFSETNPWPFLWRPRRSWWDLFFYFPSKILHRRVALIALGCSPAKKSRDWTLEGVHSFSYDFSESFLNKFPIYYLRMSSKWKLDKMPLRKWGGDKCLWLELLFNVVSEYKPQFNDCWWSLEDSHSPDFFYWHNLRENHHRPVCIHIKAMWRRYRSITPTPLFLVRVT